MTIPKAHYLPVFEPRKVPPAPYTPIAVLPDRLPRRNVTKLVLVALVVLLAATCLLLGIRLRTSIRASEAPTTGAFNIFWGQVFQPERRTSIVVSDHTYRMLQEAAHRRIPLSAYMGGDYGKVSHDIVEQTGLKNLFVEFDRSHLTGLYDVTNVAQMASLQHTVIHWSLLALRATPTSGTSSPTM